MPGAESRSLFDLSEQLRNSGIEDDDIPGFVEKIINFRSCWTACLYSF